MYHFSKISIFRTVNLWKNPQKAQNSRLSRQAISNLFCGLLLSILTVCPAQAGDVLERRIDVSFYQTPMKEALDVIAKKGAFEWSYNARIVKEKQKTNYIGKQKTIREILEQILGTEYTFKQNGEYLILKKAHKSEPKLSGIITDSNGNRMAGVTVYDRQTLRSVNSDQNGFYEIDVLPQSEIVISKALYRDTLIKFEQEGPHFVPIRIQSDSTKPDFDPFKTIEEGLNSASEDLEKFFVGSAQKIRTLNIQDTLHRHFQFSIVPGLGTNHAMSGSVVNNVSINMLAGYSRGVDGVEVAGLGNITRQDVHGVQCAGLFNDVRGDLNGVQTAGLYNRAGGKTNGVQVSGLINISGDSLTGVQIAGLINQANSSQGGATQLAGLYNVQLNGSMDVQAAGLYNIQQKGPINVQAAGLFNIADTVHGTQVSGLLNRARKVKGAQIGIINSAKEIDGVQIGLLNFSKKGGYLAMEFHANEVHSLNASFKSGTNRLYTIFTGGYSPETNGGQELWSAGMGLGAYAPFGKRAGLGIDLIHRHLNEGFYTDRLQEWEQLALGFDVRLFGGFHLTAGPSFNLLIINPNNNESQDFRSRIIPKDLPNSRLGDSGRLSAWLGWTAGARWRF
jgi:hypothetical protein